MDKYNRKKVRGERKSKDGGRRETRDWRKEGKERTISKGCCSTQEQMKRKVLAPTIFLPCRTSQLLEHLPTHWIVKS